MATHWYTPEGALKAFLNGVGITGSKTVATTDQLPAALAASGTATLVAGTVDVAATSVTADAVIRLSAAGPAGTVGAPYVKTVTAGTGFTISSTSASDTSKVHYEIISY